MNIDLDKLKPGDQVEIGNQVYMVTDQGKLVRPAREELRIVPTIENSHFLICLDWDWRKLDPIPSLPDGKLFYRLMKSPFLKKGFAYPKNA